MFPNLKGLNSWTFDLVVSDPVTRQKKSAYLMAARKQKRAKEEGN